MAGKKVLKNKKASSSSKDILESNICAKHHFTEDDCQEIQKRLLKWYDEEQRNLPWRTIAKTEVDQNVRGYAVWVSEVMLQQTQVATVIPYFNKWMEKWPTVQALAEADVEEVLQVWAGLGYYLRARRLYEGARRIVQELSGRMPDSVPDLIRLIPGIGPYSAAAIASIAFRRPVGVVDGNVVRVLCRMRVVGAPASEAKARDHLWELANKLVSKERPMDFNQALMELGATVCTPQNPDCSTCSVNDYCKAYGMTKAAPKIGKMDSFLKKKAGENPDYKKEECVTDIENVIGCDFCLPSSVWNDNPQVVVFPCKVERKAARQEKVGVLVIEKGDRLLMVRRPKKGLLAGLWEFPCALLPTSEGRPQVVESAVKELGVPSSTLSGKKFVGEVIHLFSHIHTTYVVEHLVLESSVKMKSSKQEVTWVTLEEIKTAAVSTAMKKILALVKKSETKSVKQVTKKKRKHSPENHKQRSIKSFFV